jgi:hypothetical protein
MPKCGYPSVNVEKEKNTGTYANTYCASISTGYELHCNVVYSSAPVFPSIQPSSRRFKPHTCQDTECCCWFRTTQKVEGTSGPVPSSLLSLSKQSSQYSVLCKVFFIFFFITFGSVMGGRSWTLNFYILYFNFQIPTLMMASDPWSAKERSAAFLLKRPLSPVCRSLTQPRFTPESQWCSFTGVLCPEFVPTLHTTDLGHTVPHMHLATCRDLQQTTSQFGKRSY